MNSEVCGHCGAFESKSGQRFFNCTRAGHAGLQYGMQVRSDTPSCDAFMAVAAAISGSIRLGERAKLASFYRRHRVMTLIASSIAVLLVSWLVYLVSVSAWPTETTVTGSASMSIPTQTAMSIATPMPANIVQYISVDENQWASTQNRMVMVSSASRMGSYRLLTGRIVSAPPGTVFIFIRATTVNLGKNTLSTTAVDFVLTDSEGRMYKPHEYGYYYVGSPYSSVTLSTGGAADGRIFWIVPQQASGFEVSYFLDLTDNPPTIAKWSLPW